MKRTSIQFKIGLLMMMAVILLSATGYLSYRNISSIVSSIHVEVKPELRLLTIREISMDLEKAGNSIRLYTITNDTLDIRPYYTIISNIDVKVSRLRSECMNDPVLMAQTDTISKLIEENIVIWNELLYLNNNDYVIKYLKSFSDRLNIGSDNTKETDKGILKRVFSRSNRSRLNEKELITDIQKIEQQNKMTNEKLAKRESQLAGTSTEIKEKFYDLITKMEREGLEILNMKAYAATLLARKTYIWLAMFSLSGTLLAILVMFIIVRYVRKSHAYQMALENSKDEAEKLASTKEMFVANISHEIRTPVTAISGFAEQLLHETLNENASRLLKIIKSSSDHLAKIINDILDFSKLQNSKLVLEKVHFSISGILEDVYELFEGQAQFNNTKLSYKLSPETPAVLLGDPYRLKQIIINLVGNSVKFTKEGDVRFLVYSIDYKYDEIELIMEFTDTGIGIDESKLDFIFEDFTQEEMSTTRKYGGTGLGLSIVKKLVELHHGSIECKSRKNQGTTITCRLPYSKGDVNMVKKDIVSAIVIPEEIRKMKILIVDDVEYNRLLFKTILDRWGIKYSEAVNGMEALEMVKSGHYDLIFLDTRMPVMDGLRTTQFIRNELNISASELPVICISAAFIDKDWQKYKKAGVNAFLQKPFTEEMLLTTFLSVIKGEGPFLITDPATEEMGISGTSNKINLKNLHHISGGDERFEKEMLISFIDTARNELTAIQKAVFSGRKESVANQVHKLLPPCRHIGAMDLHNLLDKIESGISNNIDNGILMKLTDECQVEFDLISELLEEQIMKMN